MNEPECKSALHGVYAPLLFAFCILFYNPSLFFLPSEPVYMAFFPAGFFSLLACSLVLCSPSALISAGRALNPYAVLSVFVFAAVVLIQYLLHDEYRLIHLAESIVWISVPFCAMIFNAAFRKVFFHFLAFFSVWQMIFFFWNPGNRVITGNINFTSALLILSLPFLLLYLYRFLRDRKKVLKRNAVLSLLPFILCGGVILLYCESRGAFLGLFCVSLLFLYLHFSDRLRRIMLYSGLFCLICGTLLFVRFGVEPLSRAIANEDRPFLYAGTVNMILDHPLFGVGGVSFENAFVKYKPLEYFFARYVADRSNHPHNQELYMLSSYGLIAYLAWLFLLYFPVFVLLLRIYRRQSMAPEIKLSLFLFLCALLHSQFDLIFYFFPTYLILLILLGLFWHEVFIRKQESASAVKVGSKTVFVFRLAGLLFCCLACLSAAKAIYSSWMTWRLMTVPMSRAERLELIQRIAAFAPDEYKQNYALLILSEKLKAPEVTLKVANAMLGSNIPNYGHLHFVRATALARLGDLPGAYEAYRLDAENYPLTVRPYLAMISLARRMGRNELLPPLESALNERLKLREITPRMLEAIRKNPFYDMRPWWIPKAEGGPGGEVLLPDGRRVNWY